MNRSRQTTHEKPPIFTALVLIVLLPLGAGITFLVATTFLNGITADSIEPEPSTGAARDGNIPNSVANAVLQDASAQANLPFQELRVVNAEPRDWSDSCLGLAPPGTFCTQSVVSGWQVRVEGGQRSFIYRTNDSGSVVKPESSDFKEQGRR